MGASTGLPFILILAGVILSFPSAQAGGPTAHLEIGWRALPDIHDPRLKQVLLDRKHTTYGGALVFPDVVDFVHPAQISPGKGELGHGSALLNSYVSYIKSRCGSDPLAPPSAEDRDDCANLLAAFMGTLGHVVGDNRFDWYFVNAVSQRCDYSIEEHAEHHDNYTLLQNLQCTPAYFFFGDAQSLTDGPLDYAAAARLGYHGLSSLHSVRPCKDCWIDVLQHAYGDVQCNLGSCRDAMIGSAYTNYSLVDRGASFSDGCKDLAQDLCPWAIFAFFDAPGGVDDAARILANYINKTWEILTAGGARHGVPTAAEEASAVRVRLTPNPNSSNESSSITFRVSGGQGPSAVSVTIFDLSGRVVQRVARGHRDPGEHTVHWDLRDATGSRVAPGVYFVRVLVGLRQSVVKHVIGPAFPGERQAAGFATVDAVSTAPPPDTRGLAADQRPAFLQQPFQALRRGTSVCAVPCPTGWQAGLIDYSSWVQWANDVSRFQVTLERETGFTITDPGSVFVLTDPGGVLGVVDQPPDFGRVERRILATGVSDFQVEKSRIGILVDGQLRVRKGSGDWVSIADGVRRFQLEGDRVAVLLRDRPEKVLVKEGPLEAPWHRPTLTHIEEFQLEGNRIAVLRGPGVGGEPTLEGSEGTKGPLDAVSTESRDNGLGRDFKELWVKEGGLKAKWVRLIRGDIRGFQLEGSRIAVLRGSDLLLMVHTLRGPSWELRGTKVSRFQLNKSSVAFLRDDGDLVIQSPSSPDVTIDSVAEFDLGSRGSKPAVLFIKREGGLGYWVDGRAPSIWGVPDYAYPVLTSSNRFGHLLGLPSQLLTDEASHAIVVDGALFFREQ